MAKLTLKFEEYGVTTKKVVENVEVLGDVISHFEEFLLGCGYVFDGNIEIMNCQGCCGKNNLTLSDEIDSVLEELYQPNISETHSGSKIYRISEPTSNSEIKSAEKKVWEDVNQMKFPFED